MKQSMFWQNPHVDVFKYYNILDLKDNIDTRGKVTVVHERELGSKKVLKIEGQNSSASYVKFPSKMSKNQSLGLIGNYVYIQMIVPTGSLFTLNIWYKVQKKTYKIVFSNLFKKIKKQNDLTLNVPIQEHPNVWSILGIDSKCYLNHLHEINEGIEYEIKQIELCPNMRVKNIYTSNNLYCLHSIPKDFQFTHNAKYKFEDKHQFIMLGDKTWQENKPGEKENEQQQQNKENSINTKNKAITQKKYLKSILKDTNKEQFNAQEQVAANHKVKINQNNDQEQVDQPRIEPKPFILEEKPVLEEKKQDFTIQPTPIMQLTHVQGYSGGYKNVLKFGKGQVVYSTGNIMVMMDLKTRVQKYFFGQHSNINNIAGNVKNNIIVSTDQTQISIWDAQTLNRTGFYYTGFAQIISMDICISEKSLYVVLGALDNQRRPCLMLLQNDQILVKQISDFDISRVKFIDNQNIDSGFISIGKESIRYWKLKKTFDKDHVLNGHSVFLGEHARENQFTDVSIQSESQKALVVSNQGNLYIVDNNKREIVGVYKIHEEACKTIQIYENSKTGDFIVTSDSTGRIKLWTSDFTNILLEVKIDSQVSCMVIYDERLILCGCLNGTLGILEREKKLFNFLVRSHNDDVILLRYHNFARKLISISSDYTIRIWEILGNEDVVFFSEVYEFRCLDDQVTTIQCFNKKEKILCGFESGNIRVFDIKNYQVTYEVDFHKAPVTSIAINYNDQTGISADQQGTIVIFNEEIQQMKIKESDKMYDNPRVGFNFRGDLYYILNDPFNLKIYSLSSDAVKFWVSTQEKIMNVTFSQHQEDFFVITEKGKIKKYKLNENTGKIVLFRQYAAMHDGVISSITPSSNCNYLFTTGEDKLIKIWDYHFRGGISPAFQAYNCGEQLDFIDLTNDDLNLVISYGKKSRTLYCWKFKQSLFESDAENDNLTEILENENNVEVENIGETNVFSNLTKTIVQGNYIEEQKESQPQDIKSIYENEERMMEQAQNQLNVNNNQQHFDQNNQQQEYQQVQDNIQGDYNDQQVDQDNQQLDQEKELLPGQYIQKQYIIGYDNEVQFPQQNFIWNQDQNYYVLTSGNYVVINNISENRNQKIFQEQHKTTLLNIAPNKKYFAYALKNKKGTIKIVDSKNLSLIKNINHNFVDNLQTVQISPCSNYLISVFTLNSEPNAFITIFELATSKIISCSTLVKPDFVMLKWDHSEVGSLEFTVLTKTSVFFYRLSNRQNLEYVESAMEQQQINSFGGLQCCEYLELQDKNILLVGSSQGALLIYDINTGSLLCICKGVINGPVTSLQASQKRLIAYSNNVNIFTWEFKTRDNTLSFARMARFLEEKPQIIQLDAVPCFISQKQLDQLDEQMVITRQGILWVVDYTDQTTLRINSSHVSHRQIQQVQYLVKDINNYHNGILFSSSNDYTMKLYQMGQNEIKTEFYAPKKECLSFDIFKEHDIVCGGYHDGYLRFFDFYENLSLGTVALVDQKTNMSYPITTVKVIPRTRNLIAGNTNGDIFMIYIRNTEKNRFKIDINKLVENVGFQVNQITVSYLDPLELWMLCTQNGKIMIWNRKCLKRNVNPAEELSSIYEIEYYLTDNYRIYKNNAVHSERPPEQNYQNNLCRAEFSKDERDIIFAISKNQKEVIMRNFREHMNVKTIPLKYNPLYIQLGYKNDALIVADTDGGINIYDYNSGIELDRQQICATGINSLELIDIRPQLQNYDQIDKNNPNQQHPPYLIASSQNQIFVYNIFI